MKIRNILPAVAAAGLVLAPVAAQAGTSASSSVASVQGVGDSIGKRKSTAVDDAQGINPGLAIAILLAAGAATYGLAKAIDNNNSSHGG